MFRSRRIFISCLNKNEEKVLVLGMNYEIKITPTKLPLHEIITSTEYTANKKLNQKNGEKLRAEVCNIIRNTKMPKSNLPPHLKRAPNNRCHDQSGSCTLTVLLLHCSSPCICLFANYPCLLLCHPSSCVQTSS